MLPRFQHLLVPVDFTLKNQAALDIAFEMAELNAARVTFLHVIEEIEGVADDELGDFYQRLESRAKTELETMAQRFADAGLNVDRKIRFGKRAEEIVRDAAERGIDLIVMNSHPIDPQSPMHSISTISYQVSILCRCPILLIK